MYNLIHNHEIYHKSITFEIPDENECNGYVIYPYELCILLISVRK